MKKYSELMDAPFCVAIHKVNDQKQAKTADYEFVAVNSAFEKTFGIGNELLKGKTINQLFSATESSGWRSIYDKLAAGSHTMSFEHYMPESGRLYMVNAWPTSETQLAITLIDITSGRKSMDTDILNDMQQQAFWDNNLFGVIIADKKGNYMDANQEACRMTGYSCEELKSMNVFSLIEPEQIQVARTLFEQIAKSGKAYGEAAYHTKSGEKRWWNVVATLFSDEKIICFYEDITNRKKTEQALANSEERFRLMIKNISAIIVTLDKNGIQQFVSPVAEKITGYTAEELTGKSISEVIHPDDLPQVIKAWEEGLGNPGKEITVQYRHIHKTKGWVYLETIGQNFLNEPAVKAVIAVVHDITERMLSDDRLEKEKLRFQQLFENSPIATWLEDQTELINWFDQLRKQGVEDLKSFLLQNPDQIKNALSLIRVINLNQAAVDQNEASSKEHLMENLSLLFYETTFSEFLEQLVALWQGQEHFEYESQSRKLNGDPLNVIIRFSVPKTDDILDYSRVIVTGTDITGRKLAEQALRESESRFREFFSQNPMSVQLVDSNGFTLQVNESHTRLFGSVPPSNHSVFKDPLLERMELSGLWDLVRNGDTVHFPEFKYNTRDLSPELPDKPVWIQMTVFPLYGNSDQQQQYVLMHNDITERKQAEQALLYERDLFSSGPVITIEWEPSENWPVKNVSPNVEQILGYIPEQLRHAEFRYASLIHPDDLERIAAEVSHNIANHIDTYEQSYRLKCADGEYRWLYDFTKLVRNEKGELTAIRGYIYDQSLQKQAEIALQTERTRLAGIIEGTNVGTWEWNVQTGETVFNERWADIIGYTLDELSPVTRETWKKYTHPDDLEGSDEQLEAHFKGELAYYYFETRMKHKNGEWVWALDHGKVVSWTQDGKPLMMLGTHQDITERKHTEDKLKASEKKFRELSTLMRLMTDNMPDMLWAKNLNKEYIFTNKAICNNLLGAIDTEEPLGKNDMFFAMQQRNSQPDDPQWHTFGEICMDSDSITLEEMKPMQFDEFGNVKGKFLFLDVHKAPLYDERGQLIGVVGSARDVTAAKEAEKQLRILSQAVEQSSASVVITDPQGNIEYVNPKFTEVTGYTLEEAVGQNPRIFNSGEQNEALYKKLWDTLSSGKEWKGEFPNKKKNGELYWESELISPIKDEKGEILHFLAVKDDITERKRDQEKIRITKDTYESIFNSVSEAIYVIDENGHFIDANHGAEILYGYSRNEMIGMHPADVLAPGMNDLDAVGKVIVEVAQTGVSQSFEFWGQRKSGEAFPKDVSINRGKYFGKDCIIATARDITERKKTETARSIQYTIAHSIHSVKTAAELLEKVRQELSRLFDTTNFFVAMYNPEKDTLKQLLFCDEMDNYDEWNASQSLSGQVVKYGKPIFLRGKEMDSFIMQHNLEVLGTGSVCWLGVPVVINNKVSGVMVIQHYTNPEAYSAADVALLEMVAHETGIYLDKQMMIEDLIRAKDHAEESDRLKSAFLANMSHEIRTPMNGILGFAELLKEPNLTGEEKQNFIFMINKSGQRMLNIINDIVDISKIEAGLAEVHLKETNINDQLDYIHNFFKPEASAKGLEFSLKTLPPSYDATLRTDREKVYAILTNLVKNAIKYTPAGKLEMGCMRKGNLIEFYVKDNGIGIPKNRQEAIFERFIQADIENRMAYQGAGLGLAITKAYVEMLGGKLWVESEQGKGSTFYFTIPCIAEPDRKNLTPLPQVNETTGKIRKLKTLIVEDDETSELLLRSIFKAFSKEVLVSHTGLEAIELCRIHPDIDLVLMDIRMPEMGGYEATKLIRAFNKDVIIIAQTAYGLTGDREKALETGCNDYISKPINKQNLVSIIEKYFGK